LPAGLALSSEHLSDEGIYLLENGEEALIYVGGMVNPDILLELFGSPSLEGVPSQVTFVCISLLQNLFQITRNEVV
jgi:protein transport protein SEC24